MWYKLKTNKSMSKRFKVTKNNKILHQKAGVSHLLTNKSDAPQKDQYWRELFKGDVKKIKNLLPYSSR